MYQVRLAPFEGPLSLLLSLVEQEKIPITDIGLVQITQGFLQYRSQVESQSPELLADFLVIVARLLYLKSKSLLPTLSEEEEEGPALVDQLEAYKICVRMAQALGSVQKPHRVLHLRRAPTRRVLTLPLREHLTPNLLLRAIQGIEKRAKPFVGLSRQFLERVASVEETIQRLREKVLSAVRFHLHEAWGSGTKAEVVTTVLALLELWKQNAVHIHQQNPFEPIMIERV